MLVTVADFRASFPEFSSTVDFPAGQVEMYLNMAEGMLDARRFRSQINMAISFYAAHELVLAARNQRAAKSGQLPGSSSGVVNSKSVDKVAVAYNTAASTDSRATHYNLTTYGQQLWRLIQMFGMGPIVVNGSIAPPLSGPAWQGLDTTPGPTNFS